MGQVVQSEVGATIESALLPQYRLWDTASRMRKRSVPGKAGVTAGGESRSCHRCLKNRRPFPMGRDAKSKVFWAVLGLATGDCAVALHTGVCGSARRRFAANAEWREGLRFDARRSGVFNFTIRGTNWTICGPLWLPEVVPAPCNVLIVV